MNQKVTKLLLVVSLCLISVLTTSCTIVDLETSGEYFAYNVTDETFMPLIFYFVPEEKTLLVVDQQNEEISEYTMTHKAMDQTADGSYLYSVVLQDVDDPRLILALVYQKLLNGNILMTVSDSSTFVTSFYLIASENVMNQGYDIQKT